MLDLKTVCARFDDVAERLKDRFTDAVALAELRDLASRRGRIIEATGTLEAQANAEDEENKTLIKTLGPKSSEIQARFAAARTRREEIKRGYEELRRVEADIEARLLLVPNLPHESVPPGKDENLNVEIGRWGEPRRFEFTPRDHVTLGEGLGMLDLERAAKLSGARFSVLTGPLARLERALAAFMLDVQTLQHGYTEVVPPYMVTRKTMTGTGQLPKFEADLFRTESTGTELFLIPTAEVPLTNLWADEVIPADRLPIKVCGFSPCFRAEAGSAGRDTRGILRQHQFHKVELVQLTRPEHSQAAQAEMVAHASKVLQLLELPHRMVLLCAGDMGFSASRCVDLEVWLPGQDRYREISSVSDCGDFQARRAKIRFKDDAGKNRLVHTLNGSGVAVGRTLIAVLENHQQADGSIHVPEVLQPYMGGLAVIAKPSDA